MLEAKTLTIKKTTNKIGKVVNFVPEIVDGNEVYSIIASSTLSNISKINGAMIEYKELDYNSYQHESDEPKKDVGQATNEVEIL